MRLLLKGIALLWMIMWAVSADAQGFVSPRSAAEAFQKPGKLMLGFDSKRSFIANRDARILGMRGGFEFDNKVRIGFGIYLLSSPFTRLYIPDGTTDTIVGRLEFNYITYFLDYIVYSGKRLELSVPVWAGVGDAGFPEIPKLRPRTILVGGIEAHASYKIFPFIGLGGGFGYRHVLSGAPLVRQSLSAPLYSFGLKLWLGWFVKKVFPQLDPDGE